MARHLEQDDNAKRVVLRYHGGKARLADWIVSFFPPHNTYVEAFGGGASVLLAKPRHSSPVAEVYNDIDHDVTNLFEVLSDDRLAPKLVDRLRLTPYSREAWRRAYEEMEHLDVLERARTLCVRVMMGWGSKGLNPNAKVVFRANDAQSSYAHDWQNYVEGLPNIAARLRGVTIENMDALKLIERNDGPQTLFYLDPPYLLAKGDATYAHDMSHEQHEALLRLVTKVQGMVIISGYPTELYSRYLQGWNYETKDNYTDSHAKRTDTLWLNAAVAKQWGTIASPLTGRKVRPPTRQRVLLHGKR